MPANGEDFYLLPNSEHSEAIQAGYTLAVNCLTHFDIPIKKGPISLFSVILREGHNAFENETGDVVFGCSLPESREIWIAESYLDNPRLWGHEFIHVLSGITTHPDDLFDHCPFDKAYNMEETEDGWVPNETPNGCLDTPLAPRCLLQPYR